MPTIGSNLSVWGNLGEYETDRSTWGFANTALLSYARSGFFGLFGFSCQAYITSLPGLYPYLDWIPQRFTAVAGKKYKAAAYVAKSGSASNGSVLEIISSSGNLVKLSSITKTFGEVDNTPTFIESYFGCEVSGTYTIYVRSINIDFAQTLTTNTSVHADGFSVFEWEDPAPPVCTIAFDLPNCVVTNETGPSSTDGSISIAITGAAGPVEYSKDNGATWQSSSLFAGLDSGTYQCKVRETGNVSCVASQSFAVNIAAPTFSFTVSKTNESIFGASDGSIAITVTGTVAPFTYSKNGGTTYQGSNVFGGLTPGTYTVTVKDFNGQILSQNVTISAGLELYQKAYFSRDPILFTLTQGSNSAEDNYNLYCDVRVEDSPGSGVFNSKFKTKLEPEVGGIARFNLRPAFEDLMKAAPPTFNRNTVLRVTDRLRFFKVYSGELYDDLLEPLTLQASNLYVALLGGQNKRQYATADFFSSFLPSTKKFLSWVPLVKSIVPGQQEYLTFFIYASGISTLKLKVICYYDDATTHTYNAYTQSGCLKGQLYEFPAGLGNTNILSQQPAKNLMYYEVQLLNQSDVVVSEKRTYKVLPFTPPYSRLFLYLNSVGGYDVLHCTGQANITVDVEKTIVQKHLPMTYSPLDGEYEVNQANFQKRADHSSGYLVGSYAKEYQQSLLDFVMSRRVYELINGQRVPVIVKGATIRFDEDDSREYYLRFSIEEAYTNHSFTPL